MNKKKLTKFTTLDELDKKMNWTEQELAEINSLTEYYLALQKLRDVKEQSGMNNEEISKKSGISRPQISNVLNGKRNATLETLMRIAASLNKTLKIDLV